MRNKLDSIKSGDMSERERSLFSRFSLALKFSDTDDISEALICGQNLT